LVVGWLIGKLVSTWGIEGLVDDEDDVVELNPASGFAVIEVGDGKVSVTAHPANSIRIKLTIIKQRDFTHLLIFHIIFPACV